MGNRRYFLRFQPSSLIVRPVVLPAENLLPTDSTTNRPTIARLRKSGIYIYIYIYGIYNGPIGHYLDMHMETAGQNDIPGKIYMSSSRGPRPKCLSSRFTTFYGACGVSHQGTWYAPVTSFGLGLTAVIAERWRNTWQGIAALVYR